MMSKMSIPTTNSILPSTWKDKDVLSETDDWIACYKPAGKSVVEATQFLKQAGIKFSIIYELDPEISGPILLAKTLEVRNFLKNMYGSDGFTFIFYAWGVPHKSCPSEWTCDLSIAWDNQKKRSYPSSTKGKKAATTFQIVQKFGTYHLFKCTTHYLRIQQLQIHSHFSYFDILGDALWTTDNHLVFLEQLKQNVKNPSSKPISEGLHLALTEVYFTFNEKIMKLEVPFPHNFEILSKTLVRYLPKG